MVNDDVWSKLKLLENLLPLFSALGIIGSFTGIIGARKIAAKHKEETFDKIYLAFLFFLLCLLCTHPWLFLPSRPFFWFLAEIARSIKLPPLVFSSLFHLFFGIAGFTLMTTGFRKLFLLKGYRKNAGYYAGRIISIPLAVGIFVNSLFWSYLAIFNLDFFQASPNSFSVMQISTYAMITSLFILSVCMFFWKPDKNKANGWKSFSDN